MVAVSIQRVPWIHLIRQKEKHSTPSPDFGLEGQVWAEAQLLVGRSSSVRRAMERGTAGATGHGEGEGNKATFWPNGCLLECGFIIPTFSHLLRLRNEQQLQNMSQPESQNKGVL